MVASTIRSLIIAFIIHVSDGAAGLAFQALAALIEALALETAVLAALADLAAALAVDLITSMYAKLQNTAPLQRLNLAGLPDLMEKTPSMPVRL